MPAVWLGLVAAGGLLLAGCSSGGGGGDGVGDGNGRTAASGADSGGSSGSSEQASGKDSSNTRAAEAGPLTVTTARVEVRRVRRTVAAVGTLFGFEEVTLTPKVEGRVVKIACEVGDRVQPGAVLLEIDPTDHQLAVDESQRSLELELAKLGLESVPGSEFAIDNLPSVSRAQLMLDNAQKRFDRQRALIAKNVATQEVFEMAETELKVAEANLRQMRLDAQATLAAVRQRQATLEVARLRLAEARVAAPRLTALPQLGADPIDYVVAQRFVSEGEMVRAFPSTPVLELVIDRVLKLRARVPERFSSQIKVGQTVEVRVDAWPDTIFPASVTRLSPTVDARNRTFELEAAVPNPDRRLKAGGFAKADIVVNEVAEATTIPLEALIRFAGVNKVFRVDKGVARETLVDLGGHGPGWVEVTRGLAAGDEVATSGVGQLADGRKLAQTPRPETPRTVAPPQTDSSPPSPPAKAAPPLESRPQGGDGASAPAATEATP
jgi:RND family efflux transporter MFP subunit